MNRESTINKSLDFMFNMLREQEGIEKGELCKNIAPVDEYSILMNRRYKMENGIAINELETEIALEEGNFIRMYIAEEFYNLHINESNNIPFPQYDVVLDELLNNKTKVKM